MSLSKLNSIKITLSILIIASLLMLTLLPSSPVQSTQNAEAAPVFVSNKVSYGIFLLPDAITNMTRAAAFGETGVHLEGAGWLYTKLAQHSSCRFISWDEIQANHAPDVDVTIMWEPKYVSNATLTTISTYIDSHNVALIGGKTPFLKDLNGWSRPINSGTLLSVLSAFGISDYTQTRDTRVATGTDHLTKVRVDMGNWTTDQITTYPTYKAQFAAKMLYNSSLSGAVNMMTFCSGTAVSTNNAYMVGRDYNNLRHAIVTSSYATAKDMDVYYNMCLWVGNDTNYNLNLWPEGKSIASYQRLDDTLDLQSATLLDELNVPLAVFVNNADYNGGINVSASSYVNGTSQDYLIGLHSTNHSYSFWETATPAQLAADIELNRAYIAEYGGNPYYFVSPGNRMNTNILQALDLAGITAAVGSNPIGGSSGVGYNVLWDMNDLPMLPYNFPYSTGVGKTSAYYWQSTGILNTYLSGYGVTPDLENMYRYSNGGIYTFFNHYADYVTPDDFETAMRNRWEPLVQNSDIWLALPDDIMSQYVARNSVDYMVDNNTIYARNNNLASVEGVGFNMAVDESKTVLVNGAPTDNVRFSNGNLYFWADYISPGQTLKFEVIDNASAAYSIFVDEFGSQSPLIGTATNRIVIDYDDGASVPFPTDDGEYILIASNGTVTRAESVDGWMAIELEQGEYTIFTEAEYRQIQLSDSMAPIGPIMGFVLVLMAVGLVFTSMKKLK